MILLKLAHRSSRQQADIEATSENGLKNLGEVNSESV
jgi:hypothetical protein